MLKKIAISTVFVVAATLAGIGAAAAKSGRVKVGNGPVATSIVPQGICPNCR